MDRMELGHRLLLCCSSSHRISPGAAMTTFLMNPVWIIDRMESNATVFEGLLRSVQPAQAKWKPAPEKWSVLEVLNHVADEENEDFGTRLRLVLEDPAKD